jgi:PEGA domain
MIRKIAACIASLLVLVPWLLFSENVRGPVKAQVSLAPGSGAQTNVIALEDLLSIDLENGGRFIDGLEVDITIPPSARQYKDLLGLYIYEKVSPEPTSSSISYTATRVDFIVLPTVAKIYLTIPMRAGGVPSSPDTLNTSTVIPPSDFPIVLTILPVAKGLPASVSDSTFPVTVSPIVADRGLLKLDVSENGKEPSLPYTLSIDDTTITPNPAGYELPAGLHHLDISSDGYKEIYRTFGIDKGQTTRLDISLIPLVPKLIFEAPETAEVFLDGQRLDGVPKDPVPVSEGEHTVIIRLGNYSLTKKFTVERGRSYKISLLLDILVQEN